MSITTFSHSGGIDKNGGHYDKKVEEYHYHKKNARIEVVSKDRYGRIVGKCYSKGI